MTQQEIKRGIQRRIKPDTCRRGTGVYQEGISHTTSLYVMRVGRNGKYCTITFHFDINPVVFFT